MTDWHELATFLCGFVTAYVVSILLVFIIMLVTDAREKRVDAEVELRDAMVAERRRRAFHDAVNRAGRRNLW